MSRWGEDVIFVTRCLMVIRSPTGIGAVGGFLKDGCAITTSRKRIESLPGDRLKVSIRGSCRPGCVAVHKGKRVLTTLEGRTGGSSGICLTASPSHRKRTVS